MKKTFRVCLTSGILFIILCLLILFSPNNLGFFTLPASANEYHYGDLTYEIRSGYVNGVYNSYAEITRCSTSAEGEIIIPEKIDSSPVLSIRSQAFENCSKIESVDLGAVQYLGSSLFVGCSSLTDILIPSSVTSASGALQNSSIEQITFEDETTIVPERIAENCSSLKTVVWPQNSNGFRIGRFAFAYSSIKDLNLPDNLTSISDYSFIGCSLISELTIPDSVTYIGEFAFGDCSRLTSLYIGDGTSSMARNAFSGCYTLSDVHLGSKLSTIGEYAFKNCSKLTKIVLPDSVRTVERYAFENCTRLSSVDLGKVVTLGDYVFCGCTSLTELTIPNTVTSTNKVLQYSSVQSLTFEEGIPNIPAYIAYNCQALTTVKLPAKEVSLTGYSIGEYAFSSTSLSTITLPNGLTKINQYAFSDCSLLVDVKFPFTLTTIGTYSFAGCSRLPELHLTDSITWIGSYAFSGCQSLSNVSLGNGLEILNEYAFNNCSKIETFDFPNSIVAIYRYAFNNCSSLSTIDLGKVVTLGDCVFSGCISLTELTIPSTLTSANKVLQYSSVQNLTIEEGISNIPAYIAYHCGSLTTVSLPEKEVSLSGYSIGEYAFSGTSLSTVTLPKGTTKINPYAFSDCALLTNINFPSTLTTIGNYSFSGCSRLLELYLANSITTIGSYAFSGCNELSKVTFSEGLKTINEYAFNSCSKIESIDLPNSITNIYSYAFRNCSNLSSADLGKVVNLGERVFSGCSSLTELTIPNTVTSASKTLQDSSVQDLTFEEGITNIPAYIAYYCDTLTTVSLPEKKVSISGYSIGEYAFKSTSLSAITLPNGLTQINQYAFSDCALLTDIEFPSTLTTIAGYAFSGCSQLKKVHLKDYLTTIGSYAFSGCNKLSEVTFGESLKTINEYAFNNCSKIESIDLPNSIVTIYSYAFRNCSGLTSIKLGKVVTLGDYVFSGCSSLINLTIPNTVTSTNKVLQYSYVQSLTFEEGIPHIPAYIAYNCGALKTVSIPEKEVTLSGYGIGDYAFYGTSIDKIALPDSLRSISSSAFGNCTLLTELVLPPNLKTIGDYTFNNCTSLRSVKLNDNLETIGRYAFAKCSNMYEINLGQGLITINEYAFQNCSNLTSFACPDSLRTIGKCAFENCVNLTDIQLAKVSTLGDYVFSGCNQLHEVTIPKTLNSSNKSLQYSSVKKLSFEKGTPHIPGYIAYGCSSLTDVVLPEKDLNVNGYAIREYAFYQCNNLTRINIPTSLTAINSRAFEGCTSMDSIRLPNGVALDATAFTNARISDLQIPTEDSQIALILIDNQVKFTADKKGILDSSTRYLRRDKTAYYKAQTTVSSAGSIPLVIEYDFKDDYKSSITNVSFTIRIPTATQLKRNSVMVNGETVTYSERNGYITFSVNSSSGRITLNVIPNNSDYLTTYAKVSYSYKGVNRTETIGIVDMRSNLLTMVVPEEVSSRALPISGVSSPLAAITIWVDDVEVGTCTANALGNYTSTVFLEGIAKEKIYKIKVQATATDNSTNSVVDYVTYNEEAIKLTEFTMYYRNAEYDLIELQASSPVISWTSDSTFSFVCSFNYNDRIEKVRVVSIKDNDTRAIDAYYDAERNAFVASGFTGYVPGVLTVEFVEKKDNFLSNATIKFGEVYSIGDRIEGIITTSAFEGDSSTSIFFLRETEVNVVLSDFSNLHSVSYDGYDCYLTIDPEIITRSNIQFASNEFFIPNGQGLYTVYRIGLATSNQATPPMRKTQVKVASVLNQSNEILEQLDNLDNITQALEDLMKKSDSNPSNEKLIIIGLKEYIDEAMNLTSDFGERMKLQQLSAKLHICNILTFLTVSQKDFQEIVRDEAEYHIKKWDLINQYGYEKVDECFDIMIDTSNKLSRKHLNEIIAELNEFVSFGKWRQNSSIDKLISKNANDNDQYRDTNISTNTQFSPIRVPLRIGIDPSGYAYEAVESNRLSGVKVTIYYRKNMDSEPIEWDASEYDQKNPLYTDEDGCYAWDVPEGLWQVKFEMDGYETTYSEWLPVPPPQLDVNIGLVSTSLPQIAYVNAYTDEIELIFTQFMDIDSVINGNVQFKHNGQVLDGFWNPQAVQKNETEKNVSYAKVFRFVLKDKINGSVTVSVSNVCNYAGNVMDGNYGMECVVNHRITSIDVPSSVQVGYKNSSVIRVQVSPANIVEGKKLIVDTNNRFVISVNNDIFFDANGVALIEVSSLLPGEAILQYMIEGTTHTGSIGIASTNYNIETDVTNIQIDALPKKTEYHKGEKFDQTGLILRVEYTDGTSALITTGFTCSPLSFDTVGTQTVTVKYGKQTTSFEIRVLDSQYTCSWENNGQITQTEVKVGETIVPPLSPVKDGFIFVGWSPVIPEKMPAENLYFVAIFTQEDTDSFTYYSITWIIDGMEFVTMYPSGAAIASPSTPHKNGYTFEGWSPTVPTVMPEHDIRVEAIFTAKPSDSESFSAISIIAPQIDIIGYNDRIVLYADVDNLPSSCRVVWDINSSNFSMTVAEDGMSCVLTAKKTGSVTVTARVVDENGVTITSDSGLELLDQRVLEARVGLWDKHGQMVSIISVILLLIPYAIFIVFYFLKKRRGSMQN